MEDGLFCKNYSHELDIRSSLTFLAECKNRACLSISKLLNHFLSKFLIDSFIIHFLFYLNVVRPSQLSKFSFFFLRDKYGLIVKRSCPYFFFVGIKIQDVLYELFLGAMAYWLKHWISNTSPHVQNQWVTLNSTS